VPSRSRRKRRRRKRSEASLRFLVNGVEFTYAYSQGYPAEALFENVEFPLEN